MSDKVMLYEVVYDSCGSSDSEVFGSALERDEQTLRLAKAYWPARLGPMPQDLDKLADCWEEFDLYYETGFDWFYSRRVILASRTRLPVGPLVEPSPTCGHSACRQAWIDGDPDSLLGRCIS